MPLSPYLTFSGLGNQAIAFYQQALKAELTEKTTYGELPKSDDDTPGNTFADSDIAHASLRIDGNELMLCDGKPEDVAYGGFSISLTTKDVAQGKAWFEALAAGGEVVMEWQETFWARDFAMVNDKFGVPWRINVDKS